MLTVHHLQVSQSERLVWLCEELNIPYDLKIHKRDPIFSPQSIKDLHALGTAPIIQDGDLTLSETAACAEWIMYKHGNGRLALPPNHANYADYLFFFHFSQGSLQPMIGRLMVLQLAGVGADNPTAKTMHHKMAQQLKYLDDHLEKPHNTWLAGQDFSAADIMTVFTLTTMRSLYSLDLSEYKNVLAWLGRCTKREAYVRAHEKGDPGLELMIDGPAPPNFLAKASKM
ncbi:hypothetical protein AAFC00_004031 [Neodothiora populina]|uniref:GST C-terminal domain-containing protein n=1 Tax=Neodothiora populina TaxID=2781224 RepID=A0ABR3PIN5_9PEZI